MTRLINLTQFSESALLQNVASNFNQFLTENLTTNNLRVNICDVQRKVYK